MSRLLALLALVIASGCTAESRSEPDAPSRVTNLGADEQIVFFNTSAWLDESGGHWHVPIHGWIYEPEDSTVRRALFATVLDQQFDLEVNETNEHIFARRLNLMIADNERGKTVVVDLAGRQVVLPPSAANGQFSTTVQIAASDAEAHAQDGLIQFTAVLAEGEARSYGGAVKLVPPTGISIISDIDDTVKISGVLDKKTLLDYTFLREFEAAPGMADMYRDWSARDASFHYVSSSPWQLYAPLDEFLADNGFPWATMNLKVVRFRDETFLDLFKKGTETKPEIIADILKRYPGRKFVLVGDSGEQDPEVYASLMRTYGDQIDRVLIRNVSNETRANDRFLGLFEGVSEDAWALFDDPANLPGTPAP